MTIRKIKNLILLALLLVLTPNVWAETTNCTPITTLPAVITVQGIYCFTGNLATSMVGGTAITINTNNVTIDLNGWKLGGLAAGTGTQTRGIYALQRKNITIRNGIIRGFLRGIYLDDVPPYTASQGHLIEDIRADQNTYVGMLIEGRGNMVRRNQVVDTGGSTLINDAFGIQLRGPGVRVINNDISATTATSGGESDGLRMTDADGAVAQNNRIADVSSVSGEAYGINSDSSNNVGIEDNHIADVGSGGSATGILINLSSNVAVEDNRLYSIISSGGTPSLSAALVFANSNDVLAGGNRIVNTWVGIWYDVSTGKYMDNLTSNLTVAFFSGTAVGIND